MEPRRHRQAGRHVLNRAVLLVGFVLFVAMLGSNIPVPLYEAYRLRFGQSTFGITVLFASYPLALVVTLFALARLPDRVGRRPALALGLVAAVAGSIAFATATSFAAH